MSQFSKNLRFLRKKGSHNQEEIAILFNKRANTIGNWENQKSEPSLSELMKLGDFFQVTTEDLLHSDLELKSQQASGHLPGITAPDQALMAHLPKDTAQHSAAEAGPDAFWLILREIRALHAKLDLLMADVASAGIKKNSDKSYY